MPDLTGGHFSWRGAAILACAMAFYGVLYAALMWASLSGIFWIRHAISPVDMW